MDDIVPSLLEAIQEDFKRQWKENKTIGRIWGKTKSKTASYKDANQFAIEVGEMLARSYRKYITSGALPEGKMWYNIATRILEPTFHTNYSLITDVCDEVQKIFNEENKVGLGTVAPEFNNDKMMGFINKLSNAERFEDVEWMLDEPVVNFSQSIVDDYIRTNADLHYKSGLTPKIRRSIGDSNPCPWCRNLAGTYDYPYVPRDVYRKHERCRCVVEYIRDGKYIQNVHTKTWVDGHEDPDARQRRIEKEAIARANQRRRQEEQIAVAELMRQHPDWSERGATIYYRTQILPKRNY